MTQTRQLAIEGMTCQMCVRHVTKSLGSVAGLTVKDVSIGSARVEYDPAAVTEEQIRQAVKDAGYDARLSG